MIFQVSLYFGGWVSWKRGGGGGGGGVNGWRRGGGDFTDC